MCRLYRSRYVCVSPILVLGYRNLQPPSPQCFVCHIASRMDMQSPVCLIIGGAAV